MGAYGEKYKKVMQGMAAVGAAVPEVMKGFSLVHHANGKDGALSAKEKELIALGIAIAIRCEGCIVCHVQDALKAGASKKEIEETVGVAILMGGGPSVIYGNEVLEILEEMTQLEDFAQ